MSAVVPPHYPLLRLEETREKLKAAGFSDDDVLRPDRAKACPILDVEAVFEAALKDFSHGAAIGPGILGSKSGAGLEFSLTDCRRGQLLWRQVGVAGEARGFLLAKFNRFTILSEQLITMPRYREAKN